MIFLGAMSTPKKPVALDPDMTPAALMTYFAQVPDPRIERSRLHPLSSILLMSLCAIVCGAESFVGIEEWAKAKRTWLESFLDLPSGIPSHDTIGRVLAALDPQALSKAFREWVDAVARLTQGEEDQCRMRVGHAAENFAVLRHLAINLLRSAPGKKLGAKTRRLAAASNDAFLEQVLAGVPVGG